MKNKNIGKGIVIDLLIESIIAILVALIFYFSYGIIKLPRFVYVIILIVLIPIFWGNLIFSFKGKNTIGQKIANRKK